MAAATMVDMVFVDQIIVVVLVVFVQWWYINNELVEVCLGVKKPPALARRGLCS